MALGIISLAMTLIRHRESIAKIVGVLPDLKTIFDELTPDDEVVTGPPPVRVGVYPVGGMEWLQDSLNTLMDAGLDVDGEYGPATNAAVHKYQDAHGLESDGWAGPETVSSIVEELSKL
jgi:peptidoglycan hydrolase-like protein with peptidoglycan-binding domain